VAVRCRAVCGRILSISTVAAGDPALWRCAEVDIDGLRQTVSLACLPQARIGDQVLVHVGLALSVVRDEL
jgi:hydrogenase expression/formation protein HypC